MHTHARVMDDLPFWPADPMDFIQQAKKIRRADAVSGDSKNCQKQVLERNGYTTFERRAVTMATFNCPHLDRFRSQLFPSGIRKTSPLTATPSRFHLNWPHTVWPSFFSDFG